MSEQPAKANAPRKFAVPSFKDVEAHKRNTEKIQPTNAFLTRGETAVAPAATAPIGVRESNPTQAIPPRAPAQIPLRELNPAQAIPPRAPAQIPLREANPTQTIPPHASAPIPLRELNPTQTIPPRAPAPFVPARLTANASHTITKEKDNTRPGQPNYHYRPKTPNAVIVNSCQRGNPILNSIRNVPYEYGSIVPDYVVGQTACALFLSLKYHRLHPEYVVDRITALGTMYVLRLLMCVVDVETHQEPLRDLNKLCVQAGLTLILAWTPEEAGKYLETFKSYEHKSPDMIRERIDEKGGYLGRLTSVLTSIKSVNKTDVITLSSNFGSLRRIAATAPEDLALCPGLGEQKIRRLREAFNEPFQMTTRRMKARKKAAEDAVEADLAEAINAHQSLGNATTGTSSLYQDRLDAALLAGDD